MARKKLSQTETLFAHYMDCEPAELEAALDILKAIQRRRFAEIGRSPRTISDEPREVKPRKPRKVTTESEQVA